MGHDTHPSILVRPGVSPLTEPPRPDPFTGWPAAATSHPPTVHPDGCPVTWLAVGNYSHLLIQGCAILCTDASAFCCAPRASRPLARGAALLATPHSRCSRQMLRTGPGLAEGDSHAVHAECQNATTGDQYEGDHSSNRLEPGRRVSTGNVGVAAPRDARCAELHGVGQVRPDGGHGDTPAGEGPGVDPQSVGPAITLCGAVALAGLTLFVGWLMGGVACV